MRLTRIFSDLHSYLFCTWNENGKRKANVVCHIGVKISILEFESVSDAKNLGTKQELWGNIVSA